MKPRLRPNVVAVFLNENKNLLVGERSDRPGIWQLPQGGIDPGETPEVAVVREASEEIGVFEPIIKLKGSLEVSYRFPQNFKEEIAKDWDGQIQTWFIMDFKEGSVPDLSKSDGEFLALDWWPINRILDQIVEWKKNAYLDGLKSLKLL